ncbi:MAG: DegV family EDD domain-containing protein [Acidimicrobiia bacterium]|nr:DegV family EDD domain-containing protein [Acidimicrobiia bacterium]
MAVGIVTDSTAALPSELQAQWGIAVVPLSLTVDGRTIKDGDLAISEILTAKNYSSASPSPGAFAKAIATQNQGEGVLVITVASTLSTTHQAAALAAQEAACRTQVVDSRTAAGGQALVAIAAARACQAGADLTEVTARAQHVARKVKLLGALRNLDQLIRSGRVPGLAGRAGNRLGIRPLFQIHDGTISKLRPALSDHAANQRILARWRHTLKDTLKDTPASALESTKASTRQQLHLVSLHAEAHDHAQTLLDAVTAEVEPAEYFISSFGQAMIINSGIGVRGLAWYWD